MILYQQENSSKPYNYDAKEYRNFRYIPHLHRDFEVVYPLEGEIQIKVENTVSSLRKGEIALILPNQIHSFETPTHSRVLVLVFSADFVPQFASLVQDKRWQTEKFSLPQAEQDFVWKRLSQDEPPDRLTLGACLQLLCAAYWRTVKDQPPLACAASRSVTLLHRILEYVSNRYTENITLRDMARDLGYEEHYLSRCFHNYFAMNFKQFINEYRIQLSRRLLEIQPPYSITEIAYMSGFGSVRNFNRVYRESVGEEPRNRNRKEIES